MKTKETWCNTILELSLGFSIGWAIAFVATYIFNIFNWLVL